MIAGFVLIFLCLTCFFREPSFLFPTHRWISIIQPFRMNVGCFLAGFPYNGPFYSILTFFIFIPAVGVLFFKEWARKFLLVMLTVHILLSFSIFMLEAIRYLPFGMPHIVIKEMVMSRSILLWVLTDIFFIWYFSRAKIRAQFC